MNSELVADYLQQHPEFFEDHADMLAAIYVPHPHGGRAISISERQILTLREKCRQLEAKLKELIQFGEENDAISERLHRITLAMITARTTEALLYSIYYNLREDFAVPHMALRLWPPAGGNGRAEFEPVSEESKAFAQSLALPYCSAHAMLDTQAWFGEAGAHLRSYAYLPLRSDEAFGLLAMASEDPQRFYPEMGTLYLKRLSELVSAGLSRHLDVA
jgi:uncharacterized protein YigA (DUF484 family)